MERDRQVRAQEHKTQEHKFSDSVSILILIDALGWNYIKDRPFLDDIAVTKRPVKSILGFSSGVIPSILTGKYPQEHKHWSLYFYSSKTSPFKWTRGLLWLSKKVLNSRISRKIIEEISKRIMGYSGYFETYLIPAEKLHLFDICENRNIYAPKGMRGTESIFDILDKERVNHKSFTYPSKDEDIFAKARRSLNRCESSYYFLYLSQSDAMLHHSCHDNIQVDEMIDYYENQIQELYKIAREKYKEVNLFVFSDHSMAPVNNGFDLKKDIEALRFKVPEDYIAFYDSTMARLWFFNYKARDAVVGLLKNREYGHILSENELKSLGVKFEDNMYGEIVFLMNTGSVICPSFMGSKVPKGMHGFSVDDGVMDAVLVSNKKIDIKIKDVKDVFNLMSNELSTKEGLLRPFGARNDEYSSGVGNNKRICKILYFLNSVARGGVEEHVLGLLENIDKERFEPILVCPQELISLMKEDLERLKIKFYPVSIRSWHNIGQIREFLKILKAEKPDIVHSHLFFATMFAAPLAKLARVPMVIETAHIREAWRKGIKKAYIIDRFFYRFTDKIIAVSNAVKEYLVTEKKILLEKIEVIHNGVDIEKFKPSDLGDSPLPSTSLGTGRGQSPRKQLTVGVIGRLEPQKGHRYFLEAIKMLGDKGDNATFSIVGEGALRNELEAMSQDFKIGDRVRFLGFRKDIQSIIQNIDFVVLPSLYEGLPLVALEAGAMGKAVIATNVDGAPEAIIDGHTGVLVPPADSHALKAAISAFLDKSDSVVELGANAICHITANFCLTKQVIKTEQLYLNTINKVKK